MFTQPCFIRKNTPELRKKLEELGYVNSEFGHITHNSLATTSENNHYTCILQELYDYSNPYLNWKSNGNRIDCGANEELFLALAALRDDSDYMQWFTDGEKWFQNKQNDIEIIHYGAGNPINFHKASVEEIIEHFKNK